MPIYDYECRACAKVTEVIHGIHDSGPRFCPECGTDGSMRKILSTPAVVFKGSGWAKVDRRSSSGGRSGGSSAGSKASAGSTKPTAGSADTAGSGAGASAGGTPGSGGDD